MTRYLRQLVTDLPRLVLVTVLVLALPFALAALILEKAPLP